MRGALAPLFLP